MNTNNLFYWLAALRLPQVGPIKIRRWLEHHGAEISTLFSANPAELLRFGFNETQTALIKKKINPGSIERDIAWCQSNHCEIICLVDPRYPKLLKEIPDPPIVLFAKGHSALLMEPQLALVGSRNPTQTGLSIAFEFAEQLSRMGLTITSGLALGIDAASHAGALHATGKTIAVMGAGLSKIYPPQNQALAEKITAEGLWISEFPPFEPPKATHFPRRNRIISGLSLGVLVIEAALKSGSLITARLAAEQGREVFVIPGSIHNPQARGCHQLIRQGAKLVEQLSDIYEELGPLYTTALPNHAIINPDDQETEPHALIKYIGFEATPMDAIILGSGLTSSEVSSMLPSLQLQGVIQHVSGGYVRLPNINK